MANRRRLAATRCGRVGALAAGGSSARVKRSSDAGVAAAGGGRRFSKLGCDGVHAITAAAAAAAAVPHFRRAWKAG